MAYLGFADDLIQGSAQAASACALPPLILKRRGDWATRGFAETALYGSPRLAAEPLSGLVHSVAIAGAFEWSPRKARRRCSFASPGVAGVAGAPG